MKKPNSLILFLIILILTLPNGCTPPATPTTPTSTPTPISPTKIPTPQPQGEIFDSTIQSNNPLPKSHLIPKPSALLDADPRLGWGCYSSNIFNDIPNMATLVYDYTNFGVKRLDTSMQEIEEPIDWSKPEFYVYPEFDQFIDDLNASGVAVNYMLHFWDKEGRANGKELETPRFKNEEQIQDFLTYVRYVVGHFKGRVLYYTLWSEPDACGGSGIKCIEPNDYIELARRTIPVILEEDPQAKIVTAPNVIYYDLEYLLTVLRSDVGHMFDVISWHGIYSAVPDHSWYRDYYYEYPAVIEEIKQTAHANGFDGEFWGTELSWCSEEYPTCHPPDQTWEIVETDKIAAKYDARGFIIQLGMDVGVGWGGIETVDAPWSYPTVQRLNTVMAGAMPVSHSVSIENEPPLGSIYAFDMPNGDFLVAFWNDNKAVHDYTDIPVTVTLLGQAGKKATGIDVLFGFRQELVYEVVNGDMIIQDMQIKDYPILIRLSE
jgi:hypothetical protein